MADERPHTGAPEAYIELADLMRRAQDGDSAAYETVLARSAEVLRGYYGRRVKWTDTIEDLIQDTLLTVHRIRHTYDPRRPFSPWLYAIAEHRLRDQQRRAWRRSRLERSDDGNLPEPAAPDNSHAHDLAAVVGGALGELPDRQRLIVELLKIRDHSVREVAQALGMSESNVKVIAHRGYRALRQKLSVLWYGHE